FKTSTRLEVIPYFRQWAPPEFNATFPPIMQMDWLEGSGEKCNPCGAAAVVTCVFTTPGSTTAIRKAGSSFKIRFRRFNAMTIPPATGKDPPDKLVPLPRATNGNRSCLQNTTSATTSSAVCG